MGVNTIITFKLEPIIHVIFEKKKNINITNKTMKNTLLPRLTLVSMITILYI